MARVPTVNQDECTSCRLCTEIAPNTFDVDGNDLAYVKNPTGDSESEIQEAIDSCPVSCISWEG
ncbi:MAG TPA: ferredoxin [Armatimonadota bacterium]|nr:ferredoxin [Armatimonadota bacterium]HQK92003.1 ferredoxin [Armatimonadota bacterium]